MFAKPLNVKAISKYSIWIKYSDNKEGIIDLSHLANKGIFKQWDSNNLFNQVFIDNETNAIAWNEELELCPNSLYLRLLGISFEQWKQLSTPDYATNK